MIYTNISFDERLENPIIISNITNSLLKNSYYTLENPMTGHSVIFYTYIIHQPSLPEPSPRMLLPVNLKHVLFAETETDYMLKIKQAEPLESMIYLF